MSPRTWLTLCFLAVSCFACDTPAPPAQDYTASSGADAGGLAVSWPAAGPPRLWARELGPGYSGIVVGAGRLYTMYRSGRREVVIALDARDGETVWEYRYDSMPLDGQDAQYGEGPNAAPLLADGRLYTVGFAGMLHGLDAATGRVLWSHDLPRELGGSAVELGCSSSPVEYGGTIIALVGGRNQAAVAFDKRDGRIVWKSLDFEISYATPAVMTLQGESQLVAFLATGIVGANPRTGELLWTYAIRNGYPQNICAPIRVDEDLVFVSTLEAGSRGLRIVRDDPFRVEELWSTTRVQCFYGAFARLGDTIYGTSGIESGPRMSAIRARTGEIVWRLRGFNLSHVLGAGERLILLDDQGKLTLATPTSDGLDVHAEAQVLSAPALTPPMLHGTVLYARDQREIVALELGAPASSNHQDSLRP